MQSSLYAADDAIDQNGPSGVSLFDWNHSALLVSPLIESTRESPLYWNHSICDLVMLVVVIPTHTYDIINYPCTKIHLDQYSNNLNESYPAHPLIIQFVHTYGEVCTTHHSYSKYKIQTSKLTCSQFLHHNLFYNYIIVFLHRLSIQMTSIPLSRFHLQLNQPESPCSIGIIPLSWFHLQLIILDLLNFLPFLPIQLHTQSITSSRLILLMLSN